MRVVVVTDKPSVSKALAAPFRTWIGPDPELTFVSTLMLGAFRYAMPRHLAWADYPVVHTPDRLVARDPQHAHHWATMAVDREGLITSLPLENGPRLLREADRRVFACDADRTGVMGFDLTVKGVLGLPLDDQATLADVPAVILPALDSLSIRRALAQMAPYSTLADRRRDGEVRRYFDHQFMINSWGVLGRCLEMVGAPREPALSKHMVQTLYLVHDRDRQRDQTAPGLAPPLLFTEGSLVHAMQAWTGTGRYPQNRNDPVRMGSSASRWQIIDNLRTLGLLENRVTGTVRRLVLTPQGRALLALLHPGCEDRDLPFRLSAWANAGLDASRPAIDRYVRTWFGRQKRRLDAGPGARPVAR